MRLFRKFMEGCPLRSLKLTMPSVCDPFKGENVQLLKLLKK